MIVWGGLIDALTFFLWGTITNAAAWICVSVLMAFDGSGLTSNTILVDLCDSKISACFESALLAEEAVCWSVRGAVAAILQRNVCR